MTCHYSLTFILTTFPASAQCMKDQTPPFIQKVQLGKPKASIRTRKRFWL